MREIKFRGMSKRTGKFVYGCYIKTDVDAPAIVFGDGEQEEVWPRTVGQFTGLHDKNGVDIYDGDIVSLDNRETFVEVKWVACGWFLYGEAPLSDFSNIDVAGNIHENPELLEA